MLSIIIPTHKRVLPVTRLLQSLEEQDFPKEELQVLLISNLADPLLREKIPYWSKKFFHFQYKEVGVKGVNKARNTGIRFARGDILYFLDDDCLLPHPQHLKNLVKAHWDQPLVAGIGGPYRSLEPPSKLSAKELFYQQKSEQWLKDSATPENPSKQGNLHKKSTGQGNQADKENPVEREDRVAKENPAGQNKILPGSPSSQLLGGNASYKKEVFEQGYFFDPSIVFGGSELSFNDSLKDKTLLFNKDLWVYHQVHLSGFSLIKKAFKQGQGSCKRDSQKSQPLSFKQEWAFVSQQNRDTKNSIYSHWYSYWYQMIFKLGYFWEMSLSNKKLPRPFHFLFVLLKSRWYFLKEYFIGKFLIGSLLRCRGLLWRALGYLWYGMGWFYGNILLFLFHHSPPMKAYYFSRYQYKTRIKPLLQKKTNPATPKSNPIKSFKTKA